jgi:hypothetical protein
MVFLRSTFVNRDLTSNETNLYPSLNRFSGMFQMREAASKLSFNVWTFMVTGLSRLED